MRRIITALAVLAASLAGVGLTVPSASAEPIPYPVGGSVSVVFNDFQYPAAAGCFPITGYLEMHSADENNYYGWVVGADLTFTVNGQYVTGWVDTKYYDGSYPMTATLCAPSNPAGVYAVSGEVAIVLWGGSTLRVPVYDTFNVLAYAPPVPPPPPVVTPPVVAPPTTPVVDEDHTSRVTAKATRHGAHGWLVTATAFYDRALYNNAEVVLQRKVGKTWKPVRFEYTNGQGKAKFNVEPSRGKATKYRVNLKGDEFVWSTQSKVLSLAYRR